jgi:hypothetical protein
VATGAFGTLLQSARRNGALLQSGE